MNNTRTDHKAIRKYKQAIMSGTSDNVPVGTSDNVPVGTSDNVPVGTSDNVPVNSLHRNT